MGVSRVNSTGLWSGTNTSESITAGTAVDSEVFTLDDTCIAASVQVEANNDDGVPASGDTMDFFILPSLDASNYDTPGHGSPLVTVDTDTGGNGEDPGRITIPINVAIKDFKIRAKNNSPNTHAITASYRVLEVRVS